MVLEICSRGSWFDSFK